LIHTTILALGLLGAGSVDHQIPTIGGNTLVVVTRSSTVENQDALQDDGTAQEASQQGPPEQSSTDPLQVNWLYGAYVPKDVPLEPLTAAQRRRLYVRQTFLTYGVYFKTAAFAVADEIRNRPEEWEGDWSFSRRFASRYGQFATQNTLSAVGNLLLQYEPRYERCRCSGKWPRIRHALARNFVTYNRTERERRPQIAIYAAAMGAGLISSTWKPESATAWSEAASSMITQAAFGSFANVLGEFAPEILAIVKRKAP
jgi:hypothetical protein